MIDAEFLLARLPAFYRERDEKLGGPLAALLGIMAEQGALLEADMRGLYDNWFIETCEPWVVPYIGNLLGVRTLHAVSGTAAFDQRALVANTLRLRRRKGTVPVLEQLAFETTGFRAHAVEFFQLLATTQHVNHLRPANLRTPNLRDATRLQRIGGPFDSAAYSAEVRPLPAGRYNIPNVGLYVWRLQAYPLERTTALAQTTLSGFFSFDALGRSFVPSPNVTGMLFNRPRSASGAAALSQPSNVPEPLSRRVLHDELTSLRQALTDAEEPHLVYFDANDTGPVLRIWLDGVEVPPELLVVCDLSPLAGSAPEEWRRPPASVSVAASALGGAARTFPADPLLFLVGFDPVLGRISLPAGKTATQVEVSYAYGFPGDIGGGPYDRRPVERADDAAQGLIASSTLTDRSGSLRQVRVLNVPGDFATLAQALVAVQVGSSTLIRLLGDQTELVGPALNLPDTWLAIEADNGRRPALRGDFELLGNENTELVLSGLLIDGALRLTAALRTVDLRHCTLVPSRGGIVHGGTAPSLEISASHCVCGAIALEHRIAGVSAVHCVFDAAGGAALALTETPLTLDRCTVLGSSAAGELHASSCLFDGLVSITRRQEGCVRFCYLPFISQTPRRYRCQPDLVRSGLSGAKAQLEDVRITPAFTSVTYGSAAYAQLSLTTAAEVRLGADDGAEMGVWNLLQQPQRDANLTQGLAEYLRFGLEAAALYVD